MGKLQSFALLSFCAGLFGCDHATKVVAEHQLSSGRVVHIVPRVLELRYARNDDVAFSALHGWDLPHKAIILLVVALVVLALTVVMWLRHRRTANGSWTLGDFGFAMILAGALGNVADRVMLGYVVDFIHLSHWPIFNIADACIVVGLVALGLSRSKARAAPA
jgi:signal peptidase II